MMNSAPTKPTATADQRRQPTRSPSTTVDKAVRMRGSVKKMPSVSGIGMTLSAAKNRSVAPVRNNPRKACSPMRGGSRVDGLPMASATSSAKTA
jgi:hypothetical protein